MQQQKKRNPLFFFLILVAIAACKKEEPNKFSDPILVTIANLQDHRQADSLLTFLTSGNPVHRREAALALASVQDSMACVHLGNYLLEDDDEEVRINAAFALGQSRGFAAVNALIPALSDKSSNVVREALEALGKSATAKDFDVLKMFQPKDTIEEEGLAWALYRVGLRGLADSVMVMKEAELLNSKYSNSTRLGAAHFFSRSRIASKGFDENLRAALRDKNAEVRMAASNALSKMNKETAIRTIEEILSTDKDYRVRVGAVRSAGRLQAMDLVWPALSDENLAVQIAAAEVVSAQKDLDPIRLDEAIGKAKDARVKSNLYTARLATSKSDSVMKKIIDEYKNAESYEKAHLLSAIAGAKGRDVAGAVPFLLNEILANKEYVIKSSAAQALSAINRNNDLNKGQKITFAQAYEKGILDGDRAVIAIFCNTLANEKYNYKEVVKDIQFLNTAKTKLKLPDDYEALQPLNEAIAYFEGKEKPKAPENKFNHPIDWTAVKRIDKNQKVLIKTSKGDIVIRLLVEEAPGSVANYVDLLSKKYFDEKYFHRVVPNFVIQGGCNRGDGYGGEDYSIRSEFSRRRYVTGSVGMASAGKDTEGTQWFITHSPTPHLDGGYSIFAETISGMDAVDAIQVGDKIISVALIK